MDALDNEDLTMIKRLFGRKAASLDDVGSNHLTMMKRLFLGWEQPLDDLDNENLTMMERSRAREDTVIGCP